MDLIRVKHFKDYVETLVSKCYQVKKGLSDSQARAIFKDTFYDDYNMLSFVLNGTYPHTERDGDSYNFVTDEMIHEDISTGQTGNVGRMTLKIVGTTSKMFFANKSFIHGHAQDDKGNITCYGAYLPFADNVVKIGFAGALMDSYNFARVSKYHTKWGDVNVRN